MNKIFRFDNIHISTPYREIYSRLGYNKHKTLIPDELKSRIDSLIDEIQSLCILSGCYTIIKIKNKEEHKIILENEVSFSGKKLYAEYSDSSELAIMFVTAGKEPLFLIDSAISQKKGSDAIVYDAAVSEVTDAGISWIHKYISGTLIRSGGIISNFRYSPGYGDFSIEHQRLIYNILNLAEYGIELTNTFMLVPEKSVTAVCGIRTADF